VLVLLVLSGVLAMHGLASGSSLPMAAPAPAPAPGHVSVHASAPAPAAAAAAAVSPAPVSVAGDTAAAAALAHEDPSDSPLGDGCCPQPCDEGGGGHLDHADGACSAAGIAGAYAPPDLPVAGYRVADEVVPGTDAGGPAAVSSRAPPDLAELQLLRI